jgi:small subunit ribosomal protein S2
MFVIDLKTEAIAVKEAQRLRIPIIGLVDTNVDPDGITYVIPGNDDAMKSCAIITGALGDVIRGGRAAWQHVEEERVRKEAEAAAARAAEEQARREAEENARREAEEAAAREAAERTEERQAEAAATRKANEPVERGGDGGRPHPAPTVAEDLPRGAGPRGKRAPGGGRKNPQGQQAGAPPSPGPLEPAKAQSSASPASAADTSPDPAPTAGAVEADPGSSTSPGADAAAAAEAVQEAEGTENTQTAQE